MEHGTECGGRGRELLPISPLPVHHTSALHPLCLEGVTGVLQVLDSRTREAAQE